MKPNYFFFLILFTMSFLTGMAQVKDNKPSLGKFALAIHGGSGNIDKMKLSVEEQKAYRAVLDSALKVGYEVLKTGGSSLLAVEKVIMVLEDSPLFNAGKGSVLCNDGTIEMDAAIMNGKTLDVGAVAGVRRIKNPISAAKLILSKSKSVFLYGSGAEDFVVQQGMELVDTSYFFTEQRRRQLERVKLEEGGMQLDHDSGDYGKKTNETDEKFGTVGCVALDQAGNLAAGTSTGGLVNKKYHRIGDSPLIGAGTYAENGVCAVSCTGKGEDFIKHVVAYDIASRIKYGHLSLQAAVSQTIQLKLKSSKGRGGCIAIDKNGNIVFNFTTSGMFRGSVDVNGKFHTAIYR
ncbi:MAG: isoaspartyl peptidase/L-asparaginase [Bacteroidetes bacterium]|nr:isoaspartyl peptidase/L-asparaginase [Bacteroidota bacterium]